MANMNTSNKSAVYGRISMVSVRRKVAGLVPQPVRFQLRKILYSGNAKTCPLCRNSVRTYISHGGGFEVLDRRQVVGGLLRENDECPVCRSSDRMRLVMLYLKNVVQAGRRTLRVLHIAPEFGLYLWLKRQGNMDYVATDLDRSRYRHMENMHKADLTDLPFKGDSFDIVICSHILEHIPDDRVAMQEILRVLKPEATALLMVPLACDGLPTEEDPSIDDPREQERRFGQWDHVRIYGRDDFMNRLRKIGFSVMPFNGYDDFPEEAESLGLNPRETLVIASKPN
jgi:SAM-dependent methyltransferase